MNILVRASVFSPINFRLHFALYVKQKKFFFFIDLGLQQVLIDRLT